MPDPVIDVVDEEKSDNEDSEQNDQDIDEQRRQMDANRQAEINRLTGLAKDVATQLQRFADQEQIDIESQMPSAGVDNPFELDSPDPGKRNLDAIRQVIREELARVQKPSTILDNMKVRYIFAVCGIIGAVNASLALLKASVAAFQPEDETIPNPFALKTPEAKAVVAAWASGGDEAAFWQKFSDYVKSNAPRSYQEQLIFSQITENLSFQMMRVTWSWDTAQDKLDLIQQLKACIVSSGLANAYALLPTLTYKGNHLPRAIASNLMSFALAEWSQTSATADKTART